jgi:hypothetical protein
MKLSQLPGREDDLRDSRKGEAATEAITVELEEVCFRITGRFILMWFEKWAKFTELQIF